MNHLLKISLIGLVLGGCASKQVAPPSEPIPAPSVLGQPSPSDPCIPANKVILVNNFSKDDLPVLISTDKKVWKTVILKGGEKNQFDAVKIKGKKGAKPEAKIFVNNGTQTELSGGNFYSISLNKGALAINRVPATCQK